MNICILSMQRINNMGSLLQAYALKKILEMNGVEVSFIDIKYIEEDFKLLENYQLRFGSEAEKTGILGKISKIDKFFVNRMKEKQKSKNQDEKFETFRETELEIEKRSNGYDMCIIGSDEVFNCLNAGYWGFTSQLFGNVLEAKRVITYAASCGATTYEKLPDSVRKRIEETFDNVSAFSVRDRNTYEFVSKLTNKEISENLDPVLIYDFKDEIDNIKVKEMPNRYCVIYSYYNRIHTKDEIKQILNFCRKNKLEPVAIGAPQFWCKKYIPCTPFECLKIFKEADFVVTDTFHGTIFATKYTDKFAVMVRESNKNKLEDLTKRLEIEEHIVNSFEELDENYIKQKNKNRVDEILEEERKKTFKYLRKNLEA